MNRFDNPWVIWSLLALPAVWLGWPLIVYGAIPPGFLVHTGEWGARLMILTLAISPLKALLPKSRIVQWFLRRRRWFGVASFAYAALHTVFYVWDAQLLSWILFVATRFYAWNGWLAAGLMLILALSSNRFSQRRLGQVAWKWLQRLTYVAAISLAIHWALLARMAPDVVAQIGALAGLELVRISLWLKARVQMVRHSRA